MADVSDNVADHKRGQVYELGYARDVCSECEVTWPCPTVAQAREAMYG